MNFIKYKEKEYPELQSNGYASRFAIPFATEFCKGKGYDIGCNRLEWCIPNAIPIDPLIDDKYNAMNLPEDTVDFIGSSHMLEHYIGRFQDVIDYWLTKVKEGGIIFLYLPNCDYQKYWAWGNKKHIHYLSPSIMRDYLEHCENISKFIVTDGYDLNGSFYVVIYK